MDGRYVLSGPFQVGSLIIEEDVRFEYLHDLAFFGPAKEEGVINCHLPVLQSLNHPLMGGRVASSNDGNKQALTIRSVAHSLLLFDFLYTRERTEKRQYGTFRKRFV